MCLKHADDVCVETETVPQLVWHTQGQGFALYHHKREKTEDKFLVNGSVKGTISMENTFKLPSENVRTLKMFKDYSKLDKK